MLSRRRLMQAATFVGIELGLRRFAVPSPGDALVASTMTTGSVTHSHAVRVGTKTYTTDAFAHSHSETPDPDAAAIADLQARVTALEASSPPPAARPFPAPVTTRTVAVPSSIDASGTADVIGALNAFIASVPDGSIISFPPTAVYRLGAAIRFTGRHNLVFDGNGATLRPVGAADVSGNSAFALWGGNTDIAIRNLAITGQAQGDGVYRAATNENRYGVLVYGGARVEVANVTMTNIWADYVSVAYELVPTGHQGADDVWVHDSRLTGAGRMGVSVINANHVLVERNTFDRTTWVTLDIEPNVDDVEGVGWVTFRDNTVLRGGSNTPEFVSANGAATTGLVHDIVISGNRTDQSLQTQITHTNRRRNVTFINNTAAKPGLVEFAHIDGLTYYGNTPSTVSVTDCTNVRTTP